MGGKIYTHKPARRQAVGHWNNVTAAGAAQFQDPAIFHGGRRHAQQGRNGSQAIGMGLVESPTWIRNGIVTIFKPGIYHAILSKSGDQQAITGQVK
jgi:hypothetical protein